jgi:hypothetical protein
MYSKNMTYIYLLEKNNIPFYIGKTKNITIRKNSHKKKYGKKIEFIILDECSDNSWKFLEKYWIEQFKQWGFILNNKNNGGGGPTKWSEEQKASINSERIDKIKNHPNRGKNISQSLNNHSQYYTDEVKQKISNALKGKPNPFTEEHIKNLTESHQKRAKTVYQFDLQGNLINEWISKGEAANQLKKELNLTSNVVSQIKDCILRKQKTAFGYIWSYENEVPKNIFHLIYQFDLNKKIINIFKSLKELKTWLKENRTEVFDINPIATSIKKESKKRIYKSGNNYYSTNKEI